jgi:hypothetical protein
MTSVLRDRLIDIVGWYGTAAIMAAYVAVSFSYLSPGSMAYQFLNATGAVGIVVVSFRKKAYQPGILNAIWAAIACAALARMLW